MRPLTPRLFALGLFATLLVSGVALADDDAQPSPAPLLTAVPPPTVPVAEPARSAPSPPVQVVVVTVPAAPRAEAPAPRATSWYGYQAMAVDGAAFAAAGLAIRAESPELALAGLALYGFGTPFVHLAHGSPAKLGADLGIRVGAPLATGLLGAGLGAALDSGGSYYAPVIGAMFGLGAGGVAAMVIDYAVLSKEPVKEERWDGKVHAAPTVAASPSGASVGVGGSF